MYATSIGQRAFYMDRFHAAWHVQKEAKLKHIREQGEKALLARGARFSIRRRGPPQRASTSGLRTNFSGTSARALSGQTTGADITLCNMSHARFIIATRRATLRQNHPSLCMCAFLCVSVCVRAGASVCVSVYLSICLSLSQFALKHHLCTQSRTA